MTSKQERKTPINQGTKDETLTGKGEEIPRKEQIATDAGQEPQGKIVDPPRYHSRTVTSPGPGYFLCDLCQSGFENSEDLEDHLLQVHPNEAHAETKPSI